MRTLILAAAIAALGVGASAQSQRAPEQALRDVEDDIDPNYFRDCARCPEMRIAPAGSFVMGAPAALVNEVPWERQIDGARVLWESPEKNVTFTKPFAIGVFEVTRDQYREFVRATNRQTPPGCVVWAGDWDRSANGKTWADAGIPQSDDHPAVCVSKEDAEAYAAWLTQMTGRKYALPTEAEWEYALRAGGRTRHPWGDKAEDACAHANLADATLKAKHPARASHACDDTYLYTSPVGMRKGNAWGLHDMAGNAWEWVADCWTPKHDTLPADGSAVTKGFCAESPLRGGAYGTGPLFTRSSSRGGPDKRTTRQSWIGFRVAAEVEKTAR
jgi:formylglycine-generating enzyme required for sulfatase activity